MKELVEYIVKQIVTLPDQVQVEESYSGSEVVLSLKVADEDMGIVIGKKGQTIRSIRKLLSVRAMNDGVRVNLNLVDVRPVATVSEDTRAKQSEEKVDENVVPSEDMDSELKPEESTSK